MRIDFQRRCSAKWILSILIIAFSFSPSIAGTPHIPQIDKVSPSTILWNATIYTMDHHPSSAEAILISKNRIKAVGSNHKILAMADENTKLIDLRGRTVLPGFIDPHTHLFNAASANGLSLDQVQQLALENGVTTIANMHTNPAQVQEYLHYASSGNMRIRLYLYLIYNDSCGNIWGTWYEDYPPRKELASKVRVNGVKIFSEKSVCLGQDIKPAFSKKLLNHFTPEGLELWGENQSLFSKSELAKVIQRAQEHGYQVAIHAIGDSSIENTIGAIESVSRSSHHGGNGYRHLIMHNHFIRNDVLHRYKKEDIVALFEPASTCQVAYYSNYVGIKNMGLFKRWADLVKMDVHVALDSDWPYTIFNPMNRLFAVSTAKYGTCVAPTAIQTLSVPQGLKMMTTEAAYAMHGEDRIGSLGIGKLADLVVLSGDPFKADPDDMMTIQVLMTMVDGVVEYWRDTDGDGIADIQEN